MSTSSVRIQPSNTQWTSPEEQLRLLQSCPYKNELLNRLPEALTAIVSAYANENLGPNTYNWYTVLRKLNLLPENIPPLPLNIHEILASTCPIFGASRRLTDTHSLWLIPGGAKTPDIDTLAEQCGEYHYREEGKFLTGRHPGLREFAIYLRTPKSVGFEAPEWIMISDLLPGTTPGYYDNQKRLIAKLRKDSIFANYEVPSFKYALAASLLKIKTDGSGLWMQDGEDKLTRVRESFFYSMPNLSKRGMAADCTLTVGSSRNQYNHMQTMVGYCSEKEWCFWERNVGIAALWVGFSPKPPESSCVLS